MTHQLIFGTRLKDLTTQRQIFIANFRVEGSEFIPQRPSRIEGGTFYQLRSAQGYDIHPDGSRFLVRKLVDGELWQGVDGIVLFQNFLEYLREKVPVSAN